MKNLFKPVVVLIAVVLLCSTSVFAWPDKEIVKTFEAKEMVSINTVSGDCVIKRSNTDQIEVRVSYDVDPEDNYDPRIHERTNSLRLNEKIHGSCSGPSEWVISVPDGTRIKFSTASGEFEAEGITGDFDVTTASGDVEFIDCKGLFELTSASGTIILEDCTGEFDVTTASGDVDGTGMNLEEASEFSTASGRVEVVLGGTPSHDLEVSTASGRATLNYNGHAIEGYFEFVSKQRRGKIISPYDFDEEETFRRYGEKYVAKSFTKGNAQPEILLHTASGRVALKEN